MNERLIVIDRTLTDPNDAAALTTGDGYFTVPVNLTVVYACAAPRDNDTGLTVDIQDDGTDIITALSCADADVPGTWISTHLGGAETPVAVVAGSKISFDCNLAAIANAAYVQIWALVGEVPA